MPIIFLHTWSFCVITYDAVFCTRALCDTLQITPINRRCAAFGEEHRRGSGQFPRGNRL